MTNLYWRNIFNEKEVNKIKYMYVFRFKILKEI